MTLQDLGERRRTRRKQPTKAELAQREREARERDRDKLLQRPDAVIPFLTWCRLNGFSKATGRRIMQRGEIAVLRLSPRRIGIRTSENARWQQSREIAR